MNGKLGFLRTWVKCDLGEKGKRGKILYIYLTFMLTRVKGVGRVMGFGFDLDWAFG